MENHFKFVKQQIFVGVFFWFRFTENGNKLHLRDDNNTFSEHSSRIVSSKWIVELKFVIICSEKCFHFAIKWYDSEGKKILLKLWHRILEANETNIKMKTQNARRKIRFEHNLMVALQYNKEFDE